MIALLQRVRKAEVTVDERPIGMIGPGLLVFLGFRPEDTPAAAERLLQRVMGYRLFADDQGRMNRSVVDCRGGVLLVPQFTLAADTRKGMRPGFSTAATPDLARLLFARALDIASTYPVAVEAGCFGADMQVALVNDGPATFWLEVNADR